MKRYSVEIVEEAATKYFYIQDCETMEMELLPSKYLMHKVRSNRSPNTIKRAAFALCYYLEYLSEKGMDTTQVCQLPYDEQNEHFVRFLYWIKTGQHKKENDRMVIHQMLGTRISDTLTLQTDCLYKKDGENLIRIRQMKTNMFVKPVSEELALLIQKAIQYTKDKYGETTYIFVSDRNPERPMQYPALQSKIIRLIHKEDLRDDNGQIFGFGTHMYRHRYGMKLTEMHLDDWTIARLLGHSSLNNVKYYRKMSNQILADETRQARHNMSLKILECLAGWEEEYEQIRQNDRLK